MARNMGTRGNGGHSLVRDKKKFDQAYAEINWKSKKSKVENSDGTPKDAVAGIQPGR